MKTIRFNRPPDVVITVEAVVLINVDGESRTVMARGVQARWHNRGMGFTYLTTLVGGAADQEEILHAFEREDFSRACELGHLFEFKPEPEGPLKNS